MKTLTKFFVLCFLQKLLVVQEKHPTSCVFGLATHFKEMLMKAVKGYFTILFDESLNKKCQAKEADKVVARYFGSQFLGHATANDMVQHFEESVVNSGLPICNLAQISMEGPSVNWKFFTDMKKKLADD